jgi:hypothetical protein
MKGRTVSFYIDREFTEDCLRIFDEELLPRYLAMPQFLGIVVLEGELDDHPQVLGLSVWDGELEDSEEVIEQFLRRLNTVAGVSAARRSYDVLRLVSQRPVTG